MVIGTICWIFLYKNKLAYHQCFQLLTTAWINLWLWKHDVMQPRVGWVDLTKDRPQARLLIWSLENKMETEDLRKQGWDRIAKRFYWLVMSWSFYLVALKQTQQRSNRAMGRETNQLSSSLEKKLLALIFDFKTIVFFRYSKIGVWQYVYVNGWHQMIYQVIVLNGFKSVSYRENNKVTLLLLLHKLSSWFLKSIVWGELIWLL